MKTFFDQAEKHHTVQKRVEHVLVRKTEGESVNLSLSLYTYTQTHISTLEIGHSTKPGR